MMASTGPPADSAYQEKPAEQHLNGQGYTNGGQASRDQHYISQNVNPNAAPKHQATISQVYSPVLKPGNPGPLGLISFAITTFCLGFYQAGVGLPGANPLGTVGPDQAIFGLAVFFGGAAQFIAGLLEFRVGNTFGCTLHCSYGAFWLSFSMFLVPSLGIQAAYAGDQRAYSVALGIYLIAWSLLTWIFFVGALRTNIAILGVLFFLAMAFLMLAVAQFVLTEHPASARRCNRAGGAFAIIDALIALYAGSSGLMTRDTTWVRFPLGELPLETPRMRRRRNKGPGPDQAV